MADPLNAADRGSLATERGPVNMAVLGVMVCEAAPGLAYDAICRRLEERIHLLPRYRQKLREGSLGVTHPVWVDDEHFDISWHVQSSTLPAPGSDAELAALVGREASRRLDRSRPLWGLHLVDGLEGDRVAVIAKMHHALVDGMAALGAVMLLVDLTPEPQPIEPPAEPWTPRPYDPIRHVAKIAAGQAQRARRWTTEAAERLFELDPVATASDLVRATDLLTELARGRPAAPELGLNDAISPNREWAFTRARLADVKAAGKRDGGTINDVVLAAVTGMLATLLETTPARDPVALVPVSVRKDGDDATEGNQISIVFVDLPVSEPDPVRRVQLLAERMAAIKSSSKIRAGALLVGAGGFAPPLMASALANVGAVRSTVTGAERSPFNLVVSNVPGPQFPLYLNGARVLAAYPVVPLNPADQGLNVGVLSYDGQICFGISTDRPGNPSAEEARAALDRALADLTDD